MIFSNAFIGLIQERERRSPVPTKATEIGVKDFGNGEISLALRNLGQRESYQCPVFDIEAHGSAGGLASPFCKSSIE
jgi:hypothetical protein